MIHFHTFYLKWLLKSTSVTKVIHIRFIDRQWQQKWQFLSEREILKFKFCFGFKFSKENKRFIMYFFPSNRSNMFSTWYDICYLRCVQLRCGKPNLCFKYSSSYSFRFQVDMKDSLYVGEKVKILTCQFEKFVLTPHPPVFFPWITFFLISVLVLLLL